MARNFFCVKLLSMFIVLAVTILVKSYFDMNGYLSPDSMNYLRLAQNLLDGNGYKVTNYLQEDGEIHFAVWPVGYSTLIFLVAKMTFLDVFWAAKVLNISFIGLSFVMLHRLFGKQAYLFGFIFFLMSIFEIFTYTWSEAAFLFGLLWFSTSLYRYLTKKDKSRLALFELFMAMLFLFLIRYIGLFAVGVVGLLALYTWLLKERQKALKLLIPICLTVASAGLYLLNNYWQTGYATGMPRIEPPESKRTLLRMLFDAQLTEFNPFTIVVADFAKFPILTYVIPLTLLFFVSLSLLKRNQKKANAQISIASIFFVTGSLYFFAIVFMRFTSHFDQFNFRLLAPATFMFILAFLSVIWSRGIERSSWKRWQLVTVALCLLSFSLHIATKVVPLVKGDSPTYIETREALLKKYEWLPKNSMIAFADRHIEYLRTDVFNTRAYYKPYFSIRETMRQFLERISDHSATEVFIEINHGLNRNYFDESIQQFMAAFPEGEWLTLAEAENFSREN